MIDVESALLANHAVIPRIYEAAAAPECWPAAVEGAVDFLDSNRGFVTISYLASRRGEVLASLGFEPEEIETWERKYAINDWVRLAASTRPGEVMHAAEAVPVEEILQTPMGRELIGPMGIRDAVGVKMSDSPHLVGVLSTYSPQLFEERTIDRLAFLAPHLARGLALHQRISALSERESAFERGIDGLVAGLVLLRTDGAVLHVNRAAAAILEQDDGVRLREDRLEFHRAENRGSLAEAIEQALAPRPDAANRGLFRIARASGGRAYHAVVSPAVRSLADPGAANAVLLWITDPDVETVPSERAISTLLGLTPAEARIAAAIAGGQTVKRFAEAAGIAESTARWTLKQVLAKTESRSQAQLVRLVLQSVPSPPF